MRFTVGLTGGIGSGKTVAGRRFEALGATLVDTDEISRNLTGPHGEAMPAIESAFGARFVTAEGGLDRGAMRLQVFTDEHARARLEAILHPLIRRAADRALEEARGTYSMLVVPLLFETRAHLDRVHRTLVVDSPEAVQVERVVSRSALEQDEVRRIMAAQWPRWRRLQNADDVVWNGGELAALERQCDRLHAEYCERARAAA